MGLVWFGRRGPIAARRQTLAEECQTIRASEPGRLRYTLANAGDCFFVCALSEQCPAVHDAKLKGEREPLFCNQRLDSFDEAQGSLGFAAIEVKHRAESESETQRERMGDPLRHGDRIGDACERRLGIAEQPFGPRAQ